MLQGLQKLSYRLFPGRALKRFRRSSGRNIDISKLIPYFAKNKGDPFGYTVVSSCGGYGYDSKAPTEFERVFYFDAPYRFILCADRSAGVVIPIACISFDKVDSRTVCIKQVQGPSYGESQVREDRVAALAGIKWERLLVQVVCEWARDNGLRSIQMISCRGSSWYKDFRHDQMFMRYDVTARRMGFRLLDQNKYVLYTPNVKLLGQTG